MHHYSIHTVDVYFRQIQDINDNEVHRMTYVLCERPLYAGLSLLGLACKRLKINSSVLYCFRINIKAVVIVKLYALTVTHAVRLATIATTSTGVAPWQRYVKCISPVLLWPQTSIAQLPTQSKFEHTSIDTAALQFPEQLCSVLSLLEAVVQYYPTNRVNVC